MRVGEMRVGEMSPIHMYCHYSNTTYDPILHNQYQEFIMNLIPRKPEF